MSIISSRSPHQNKFMANMKGGETTDSSSSPSSPSLVSDFSFNFNKDDKEMEPLQLLECFDEYSSDNSKTRQKRSRPPFDLRPKRSRYSEYLSGETGEATAYVKKHQSCIQESESNTERIQCGDSAVVSTPKPKLESALILEPPAMENSKVDIEYPTFKNEEKILLPLLI